MKLLRVGEHGKEIPAIIDNQNNFRNLSNILKKEGNVEIMFELEENNKKYTLKLKNKRFVDRNILNSIKNQGILTSIL